MINIPFISLNNDSIYQMGLIYLIVKDNRGSHNQGALVDSVIQVTGTMEFEDGLRTGVLPGGCLGLIAAAPSLGSIPNSLGSVCVGPGGRVVVIGTLLSDQIPVLLCSAHW